MEKLYIVEARNHDGSLNVKHYDKNEPKEFITGIKLEGIFKYYFKHNKGIESATQDTIREWYSNKGLSYRVKTW